MIRFRKYNTATHVYIPILKRGFVDFAVGADWTPAAGDVKVVQDGTVLGNITNLPTAIVVGNTALWDFSLVAAELVGKKIQIVISDAATKAVEDDIVFIETYGHASAEYQQDLSAAQYQADVAKVAGTAQTAGDIIGRIGAPVLASISADIAELAVETDTLAAIKAKTDLLPATPASTGDAMALTVAERAAVSDKLLGRRLNGGADGGRTVAQALAFNRNKFTIDPVTGAFTVYDVDDVTVLWTGVATLAVRNPVTVFDPA